MNRCKSALWFLALVSTPVFGVRAQSDIVITALERTPAGSFRVHFLPPPGMNDEYLLERATEVAGPWTEDGEARLERLADEYTFVVQDRSRESSPVFLRVAFRDSRPPAVGAPSPMDGAVGVDLLQPIEVVLTDDSGVDPDSIRVAVNERELILGSSSELSYHSGTLTLSPKTPYGGNGETVTIALSVSDTRGNRLENYTWSFALKVPPVVPRAVVPFGQDLPLDLLSSLGDTLTFQLHEGSAPTRGARSSPPGSYPDHPPFGVDYILAGTDTDQPYLVRVLSYEYSPETGICTVLTEPTSLEKEVEKGSFREIYTLQSFRKEFGDDPFYEDDVLSLRTPGVAEVNTTLTVSAEVDRYHLKRLALEFVVDLTFECGIQVGALIEKEYSGEASIFTWRKFFILGWIGPIPVWVEIELDVPLGVLIGGKIEGELKAGVKLNRQLSFCLSMHQGEWSTYTAFPDRPPTAVSPEWGAGLEFAGKAEAYLAPKLSVYLVSLAGASVDLRPYLALEGHFQLVPTMCYDWELAAGLTSDLAVEVRGWQEDWGDLPQGRLLDYKKVLLADKLACSCADSDGDGVCDDQDVCGGFDDHHDSDGDGVPDGCDGPYGTEEQVVYLPGGVPFVLVLIPAGTFQMGSPDTERSGSIGEGPVHTVTLGYEFYLGKYEVTQAQWVALMGSNPSCFNAHGDASRPVNCVSWNDAKSFIAALNAHIVATGQGPLTVRLPSEAEWEYACRAGTQTRFSFGDSLGVGDGCEDDGVRNQYMWYCGNTSGPTHPAGTKRPNAFGLYDMHGSLMEWCEDWWHDDYAGAPRDGSAWVSPTPFGHRVMRGGGWLYEARWCRSAARGAGMPNNGEAERGLRLAAVQ